jgi:hypothetical protein
MELRHGATFFHPLGIFVLIAAFLEPACGAYAQYVCRFDDTHCQQRRVEMQRALERELMQMRKHGSDRHTPLLGMRNGRIPPAQSKCDVKPVISGQTTRVVPTCAQ